jgi:hypothetical protein
MTLPDLAEFRKEESDFCTPSPAPLYIYFEKLCKVLPAAASSHRRKRELTIAKQKRAETMSPLFNNLGNLKYYAFSIITSGLPVSTTCFAATLISAILPFTGAMMGFSIFIDSM